MAGVGSWRGSGVAAAGVGFGAMFLDLSWRHAGDAATRGWFPPELMILSGMAAAAAAVGCAARDYP